MPNEGEIRRSFVAKVPPLCGRSSRQAMVLSEPRIGPRYRARVLGSDFTGENVLLLWHRKREKTQHQEDKDDRVTLTVRYLKPEERSDYEVQFDDDGKLVYRGKRMNTAGAAFYVAMTGAKPDRFIWAMSREGAFYAADQMEELRKGGVLEYWKERNELAAATLERGMVFRTWSALGKGTYPQDTWKRRLLAEPTPCVLGVRYLDDDRPSEEEDSSESSSGSSGSGGEEPEGGSSGGKGGGKQGYGKQGYGTYGTFEPDGDDDGKQGNGKQGYEKQGSKKKKKKKEESSNKTSSSSVSSSKLDLTSLDRVEGSLGLFEGGLLPTLPRLEPGPGEVEKRTLAGKARPRCQGTLVPGVSKGFKFLVGAPLLPSGLVDAERVAAFPEEWARQQATQRKAREEHEARREQEHARAEEERRKAAEKAGTTYEPTPFKAHPLEDQPAPASVLEGLPDGGGFVCAACLEGRKRWGLLRFRKLRAEVIKEAHDKVKARYEGWKGHSVDLLQELHLNYWEKDQKDKASDRLTADEQEQVRAATELPLPREVKMFHHSSFLAGGPVAAAGEMEVKDGRLVYLSNQSGHYLPTPRHLLQALIELKRRPKVWEACAGLEVISADDLDTPLKPHQDNDWYTLVRKARDLPDIRSSVDERAVQAVVKELKAKNSSKLPDFHKAVDQARLLSQEQRVDLMGELMKRVSDDLRKALAKAVAEAGHVHGEEGVFLDDFLAQLRRDGVRLKTTEIKPRGDALPEQEVGCERCERTSRAAAYMELVPGEGYVCDWCLSTVPCATEACAWNSRTVSYMEPVRVDGAWVWRCEHCLGRTGPLLVEGE